METNYYHAAIDVTAPADETFEKINRVCDWWTAKVEGNSAKINDVFTVRFGDTFVTFKIIDLIPESIVVWLVTDCNIHMVKDKKEWQGTKIVWEVSHGRGKTRIDMTHIGLTPGIECYEMCNAGWNFFIKESLFSLITGEKGFPDRKKAA